jgi:MFS family permease
VPLLMMAVVGCLAYEFQVTLPYMAAHGLHVGPRGFGFMTAAMGLGAVGGGLVVAARGRIGTWRLVLAAAAFGVALTLAALAPTLATEIVALTLVGAGSIAFMSTGNATLQLRAAPEMRGRVMALWFVGFQGSTPIGGPIVGVVMATFGARAGLGLGALTCLIVALCGALLLTRRAAPTGADSSPATSPTKRGEAVVEQLDRLRPGVRGVQQYGAEPGVTASGRYDEAGTRRGGVAGLDTVSSGVADPK